jgi:hypothetical protein
MKVSARQQNKHAARRRTHRVVSGSDTTPYTAARCKQGAGSWRDLHRCECERMCVRRCRVLRACLSRKERRSTSGGGSCGWRAWSKDARTSAGVRRNVCPAKTRRCVRVSVRLSAAAAAQRQCRTSDTPAAESSCSAKARSHTLAVRLHVACVDRWRHASAAACDAPQPRRAPQPAQQPARVNSGRSDARDRRRPGRPARPGAPRHAAVLDLAAAAQARGTRSAGPRSAETRGQSPPPSPRSFAVAAPAPRAAPTPWRRVREHTGWQPYARAPLARARWVCATGIGRRHGSAFRGGTVDLLPASSASVDRSLIRCWSAGQLVWFAYNPAHAPPPSFSCSALRRSRLRVDCCGVRAHGPRTARAYRRAAWPHRARAR